jgi:hypothetical protein
VRSLEILRLDSEHKNWLRDERLKSYADFFLAGEDVFHFLDSELPGAIRGDSKNQDAAKVRWRELSIQLRKTYNQFLLFGSDETRPLARELWRKAWYGGRDFFQDLSGDAQARDDLPGHIRETANSVGVMGDNLIEVCRREFQTRNDASSYQVTQQSAGIGGASSPT